MTIQSLRTDMHRAHIALDKMQRWAVVTDRDGIRWTLDGMGLYWHSEDGEVRSSFGLAQLAPLKPVDG